MPKTGAKTSRRDRQGFVRRHRILPYRVRVATLVAPALLMASAAPSGLRAAVRQPVSVPEARPAQGMSAARSIDAAALQAVAAGAGGLAVAGFGS